MKADTSPALADGQPFESSVTVDVSYLGTAPPSPVETSQIPETSTWALLIVAVAFWLLRLRGRSKRRSMGL